MTDEPLHDLGALHAALRAGEEVGSRRPDRGHMVDIQFLREVMYALDDVSIGTHQLLYFAGQAYTRDRVDMDAETEEEAVPLLADAFDAMNVGDLAWVRETDDGFILRLSESAITGDGPYSDRPLCFFIAGYIAGYMENATDEEYVVHETTCSAQGGESCTFHVIRH